MIDHIDREPIENATSAITLWAVSLPADKDRAKYIENCFFTSTISIVNDNGQRLHRIPIAPSLLRDISFPQDTKSTGSLVLCAAIPYSRKLFVIQTFNDASLYTSGAENIAVFKKTFSGRTVELILDASKGTIDLNVDSDSDGGEVNINVSNQNRTGSLNMTVNGNVNLNNDGNVNVRSSKLITLTVNDDSDDDKNTQVSLGKEQIVLNSNKQKVLIDEGKEPMALGQTLADLLKDLITELSNITTTTSIGIQPIINKAKVIAFKDKVDSILSKIGFTS